MCFIKLSDILFLSVPQKSCWVSSLFYTVNNLIVWKKIAYVIVVERKKKIIQEQSYCHNTTVALVMITYETQPFWRYYSSLHFWRTTVSMKTTVIKYSCNMKIHIHRMVNFLDTWYGPKDQFPCLITVLHFNTVRSRIAGLPQRAKYYHATAILLSGSFPNQCQNLKA